MKNYIERAKARDFILQGDGCPELRVQSWLFLILYDGDGSNKAGIALNAFCTIPKNVSNKAILIYSVFFVVMVP